jgi:amino acid adenylation domain-containing protein
VVLSESAKKPATATELRLEKLWNRLLPGVDVRSDSRFDEAGGDSLATMRLSHLIEREFGKRVRIRTLIQLPTFESQVSWLEKETLSALPAVSEPLTSQQGIETSAFELTDLQQSYWVARQIRSPDSSHNTHLYCELEVAHLNVERLSRAWNALIVHHQALRTIVLPSGLQQVLPPRPYQIVEIDWSLLDDRSRAARLDEHRRRVSHECFDLHCWPLFSVHAIKISAAISILTVSIDLLIVDAWSLQILERQLASLYHQPDYVLPRAEITLATVIRYFHARVGGDAYARSRKYWLSRVAGFPPAPQLPMRRSQPAAYRVSRREIRVGAEDCNSLSRLAERMKLSRTSLMLAIFVTILERWSAASAFSIALTVLDRPLLHEDIDNLLGNFTSMIPLGVDVKPAEGFMALWRQVHQQLLDDLDHMEYSGVKFLRELRREPGVEPPRMSYVFTRITGGGGRVEKTPTLGRERFRITQTSDVWIDNQVVDTDDGSMRLHWDACDEVFEAGVVDAMFEAYGEAVRAVVMAAGSRQSEIELNDNVGRELPLSQRRKRKSACMTAAHDINYLERIQHAAADFPQNLAVISADREITHRQLWHEATQLADQLREVTQPGECIGLHMSPGWQQVVAILATQISGRTYVPLSWQWPSAKVNGIVGEFRIRTVLTEDLAVSSRSQPSAAMSVADDANPLAYIMFTSGSTGQPKGVMMRRHAVGNTLADLVARLHLGPADRILALADISFDLSVFDILGALMVGAAIVIPGPEANRNPKLWWEWCHSQRVSIWNSVPAYMDLLMHYAQDKPQLPPLQLRWILLSGDWIDLQLPARLADKFPQARILSLGGATEAGIWSVAFPITQIEPDWRSIPYGMPLTNQDCGVVDDFERECPDWVVGELRIYGNSLSEGYLNAPQLTERQFRVEPRSGRRCYLTGDLARYRPDGVLELIGRKDAQVKIAGNRIECGEIEHVIRRCAGVTGAVVIPLDENHGVIKLHAVLALANEGTIAQVKEHCRASLPSPVLPSYWHTDIAISLSDTGKVNKRLLKERIAQKLSQGLEV